jgi:hypothetical protein
MKYYLKRSRLTQPKNRAQKHLQEFIENFSNMLVNSDEELGQIIERIATEVAATNARHPNFRSTEIDKDAFRHSDSVNLWLHAGIETSFVSLHAWKVLKEFDETLDKTFPSEN